MWSDRSVQKVVEQAIAETRLQILNKAAEWHRHKAQEEDNLLANTAGQAGSMRIMFAHKDSERFLRSLAAGTFKQVPEERLGSISRIIRKMGLDDYELF